MQLRNFRLGLAWLCFLLLGTICARANVYPTDIKLNGFSHNAAMVPGTNGSPVEISYILNEPATEGVSVQIFSGTNLIQVIDGGTNLGTNSIIWDGTDTNDVQAAPGIYSASITAATDGYTNWTQITDDDTNFYVTAPRGIDVNKNAGSPFYGRVFVANAYGNAGILKYNADGSPGDEGPFSNGGYTWADNNYSPWKISIAADDKVYVNDFWKGVVLAFDEVISTNYLIVLRTDNYFGYPEANLSGLFVRGSGTNTEVWMTDFNGDDPTAGILEWNVGPDGIIESNDLGTIVVDATTNEFGPSPSLYDVSVDTNGNIYTVQWMQALDTNSPVIFGFPPYDSLAGPETNSNWDIDGGDTNLGNVFGIAVDPTATLVAVAVRGNGNDPGSFQNGAVNLYYATNGSPVARLDGNAYNQYTDVAWDNVGNLYACFFSPTNGLWRAYSPPGANEATTAAVPLIQVLNSFTPPNLCSPACGLSNFTFTLTGQSNVTYVIEQSLDLVNWTPVATNFSTADVRSICLTPSTDFSFFRATLQP